MGRKKTVETTNDETLINNVKADTVKMYRDPLEHAINVYDVPVDEVEDWKQFSWSTENKWHS